MLTTGGDRVGYSRPRIVPEDTDLTKAAEILTAGKIVAMLVGAGARGTAPLQSRWPGKAIPSKDIRSILAPSTLVGVQPSATCRVCEQRISESQMSQASLVQEHMDVISSDWKTVGKVDHLDGLDKIKLTKQSSPNGEHHHFIPVSWIDHVDQHVHLNKTGADVTAHWEHEGRV
jgi:hypothetical protein